MDDIPVGKDDRRIQNETELWMRREIPKRMAEYDRDHSIGIPLEQVIARLDELHRKTLGAQ